MPHGPSGARRSLSEQRERSAGAVFDALADGTRRAVLRAVVDEGPITATELAARLPVSRQAIGKHLDALRGAGLVTAAKQGRDVRFAFEPGPLQDAVAWITVVGERWDRRLAALERRVREGREGRERREGRR